MTNELEKQFFDTFGIEPKLKTFAIKQDEQGELTYPFDLAFFFIPEITKYKHKTIKSISELENFISKIDQIIAIDTETTGLNPITDKDVASKTYLPLLSANPRVGAYFSSRTSRHSQS